MDLLLTVLAVLPAIVLCIYIFKKDRAEKEPFGLLLLLFFAGAMSCFPAAYAENFLTNIIDIMFRPFSLINASGDPVMPEGVFYVYKFVEYFFVVALVEEVCKFIILYFVTNKNKNFNCLFDGIIYAVFVSLGFAALENIFYVLRYGFVNALVRAVLSVPAHMFFAVMMGYYYTFWNVENKLVSLEKKLRYDNIAYLKKGKYIVGNAKYKMIVVPILAHGLYDFCCAAGTALSFIVFIGFVVFMYVSCFKTIKSMSFADGYSNQYAKGLLMMKYPELTEYIKEKL